MVRISVNDAGRPSMGSASAFIAISPVESRPLFELPSGAVIDSISFEMLRSCCLQIGLRSPANADPVVCNVLPNQNGSHTFVAFACVSAAENLWFCLCSPHACFALLESAVAALRDVYLRNGGFSKISPFIASLLAKPFPAEGKTLDFRWVTRGGEDAGGEEVEVSIRIRPRMKLVPFVDDSAMATLVTSLSLENIVCLLYQHVMVEHSVVIESSDLSLLAPFIEAIISLMYPIKWQGLCLPILPDDSSASLFSVLHSSCPFILGIHTSQAAPLRAQLTRRPVAQPCVIVSLDTGVISICTSPGDSPAAPVTLPARVRQLPSQVRSILTSKEPVREVLPDHEQSLHSSASSASLNSLNSCESRLSSTSTRISAASSRASYSNSFCDNHVHGSGNSSGGWLRSRRVVSRRFVDACRTAFMEVSLHYFSESRLGTLVCGQSRRTEQEYVDGFDSGDRPWLERVVDTRGFVEVVVDISNGRTQSFSVLSRAWDDVAALVKQKTMFSVLLKLILELDAGYSAEAAKAATVQLMQLPFDQLNEAIGSLETLKTHLAALGNTHEQLTLLRRANLKRSIKRPKERRCPPVIVRVSASDNRTMPAWNETSAAEASVQSETSGGWSRNGVRLCAVSLTGVVEVDHFDAVSVGKKAKAPSLVYAMNRNKSLYKDTLATLSRTQSAQNVKDLAAENERLKQELARMKLQLEGQRQGHGLLETKSESVLVKSISPPLHPLKRSESESCVAAHAEAKVTHVRRPSPLATSSTAAENVGLLREKENRNFKFEPQMVRRRTSVLFKRPSG